MTSEKKYTGYGYHGGGRKPSSPDGQPRRTSMTISGTKTEIEALRKLSQNAGKSTSRYVIERVLDPPTIYEYIQTETKKAILEADNRHVLTIEEIQDSVKEVPSCLSCEYMSARLDEEKDAYIGHCKIGHPCTGDACQHYKS